MVIIKIKINRKLLKIVAAIVLVGSLGFSIYSYIQNIELANKYESLISVAGQFDKANLVFFVASANTSVHEYKSIEIFDITKGEVIRKVQSNPAIRKEVENFLKGITGMYVKVKAFPDRGYIIKVPLEPSAKVQNQWLINYGINSVDEVFILFPEQEKPYLLVLDAKKRPLFYNFDGNTDVLLMNLNFEMKTSKP